MIRSLRCKPAVIWSRSLNPVGTPGDRGVEPGQFVDAPHHIAEHVPDGDRFPAAGAVAVRDVEDAAFRFVEEFVRSASLRTKRGIGDLGAGSNEIPQDGAFADDSAYATMFAALGVFSVSSAR